MKPLGRNFIGKILVNLVGQIKCIENTTIGLEMTKNIIY